MEFRPDNVRSPDGVRAHLPFFGVTVLAIALHVVRLGDVPSPAGDEGNWTAWALDIQRGEAASLPPDASFVSLAYARLVAVAFGLFGPSATSSRLPNALAILACVVAAYVAFAVRGERRSGLFAAAAFALHPWTLAWGRTAAVPYALALASGLVGALLFEHASRQRHEPMLAAGVVCVALGAHVSPLAVVAAVAAGCLAFAPDRRWVFRSPAFLLGLAVGGALAFPVLRSALEVASQVDAAPRALSTGGKLARFAHMVLGVYSGEATLRHFGSAALPVALAPIVSLPGMIVIGLGARVRNAPLATLASAFTGAAWVLLPLLLAPARNWYLPDVDRERYLFVFLPGFLLAIGVAARTDAGRASRITASLTLALLTLASGRLAYDALAGGGPDRGADVFAGGEAYRGFRGVRGARSPLVRVADAIERSLPPHSGVVLAEASLRPLGFELLRRSPPTASGHPRYFFAEAEYYPDPYTFTGDLAFVVYADEAFGDTPGARAALRKSASLRARMRRDYVDVRRVLALAQPNGRPLLELFIGRRLGPPRP